MKHSDKPEAEVRRLTAQIDELNDSIKTNTAAAEARIQAASQQLLAGKNTSDLEADIQRIGSRIRITQAAKATAQAQLIEASKLLEQARREDAQVRMAEIGRALGEHGRAIRRNLDAAVRAALAFGQLLDEARKLRENGISLSPIKPWVPLIEPSARQFIARIAEAVRMIDGFESGGLTR